MDGLGNYSDPMAGLGNYSDPMAGQDLHAPASAFLQRPPGANTLHPPPPTPPPPHSRPGPFSQQQSVYQQEHPSFHPTPGASAYMHAIPSFSHQGPPGTAASSAASSGMISAQVSRTSELCGPWSVLPMPYPQGHTLERGQSNQLPSHAPLPRPPHLPHYPSSSSSLVSDPFGFCWNWKNSIPQPVGPLPPPTLPPPPSLPLSDVSYKNEGSHSSKDLSDGDNLVIEHPPQAECVEDRNVRKNRVTCQNNQNVEPKLEAVGLVVAHSPACSDMEMEDDITHPDAGIKDFLSSKLYGGCTSISQDFVKEQGKASQHTGEHRVSEDGLYENLLLGESTVLKDQRGGSDVVSHSDADKSGMKIKLALEASVEDSSSQLKNFSQSNLPVVCEETGNGRLSGQLVEAANSFNFLHGYTSDNIPEHGGENLLEVVTSPAHKGGPLNSNACEGHKFESKVVAESLSGPNKRTSLKSVIEPLMTSTTHETKDHLWSYDASISPDGAKIQKQSMKSNFTESKVDEFGRLVREGVSDSDTSGSPRYSRRHARRARRSSSSRSRSGSPHGRRRRRSPWRRKGWRDRSLSMSPRRRRRRSRSPVSRRGTEFSGDKHRRKKTTQLQEKCFDFLRGRCYRGATCRFSHSEANKNERSINNRDKDIHDKEANICQDVPGLRKDRDAIVPLVESNTRSPDKLNNLDLGSLSVVDVVASNVPRYSTHDLTSGNPQTVDLKDKIIGDSLVSESSSLMQASSGHIPADKSDADKGLSNPLLFIENPLIKTFPTEEVQSQSLTELPASVPSQCTLPLPSVSQAMTAPIGQNYNLMQPIAQHSLTFGKQTPCQAPLANQPPHFPGPSNSLLNPLPPPPLPHPPHHFSAIATFGENGYPPQHTQQPLQPPWNGMPCASTMDQATDLPNRTQTNQYPTFSLPRENLSSLPGGLARGEHMAGYPMQGTNPSQLISLAQPYSLMMNQPSYMHNFVSSRLSSQSIPYASTFELPPGSKFEPNASVQENETTISSKYGTLVSSSSLLPDQSVLPRSGGDQYDPLYDSIEPASTLYSGADPKILETPGGSNNVQRLHGLSDMEIIKQEGGAAVSTNDFIENEEFGETADVEVGDVLNGSLSSPNDGTNMNASEIDIDQVAISKKKMKAKDSLKLFKISIASFVKKVLQPSWRQGNMSKEVFKTIVKKTVDKVSGAMKGHRVPKSQANINHYIDSSRGKLIKLVMGYVDKYVKV